MAMTAAPAAAAAPMLARFMPAPDDFEPPAAVVVAAAAVEEEETEDTLETDEAAALLVEETDTEEDTALVEPTEAELMMLLGATLALEAPAPVLASVEDADALPEADAVKQPEVPGWMENAADDAVAPVLSRIVRPMEVPDAMLVDHV